MTKNEGSGCIEFAIGDYPDVAHYEVFSVEPLHVNTSDWFYVRYNVSGGIKCEDGNIMFTVSGVCKKSMPCEWVKTLPNEENCYARCRCDSDECQGMVIVGPMTNNSPGSLCSIERG